MAKRSLNEGAIGNDDRLSVSELVVERDEQLVRLSADDFPMC